MRILLVLYIVWVVRLGSCGCLDCIGSIPGWIAKKATPPTSYCDYPSQNTLDLETPSDALCKVIGTNIEGIPAKVYIVKSSTDIEMVVHGKNIVWQHELGGRCTYLIAYLKDDEAKVVLIKIQQPTGPVHKFYRYRKGTWYTNICRLLDCANFIWRPLGWYASQANYKEDLESIRGTIHSISEMAIDIAADEDDKFFKLSKYDKDNVEYRNYTPQTGFKAKKVVCGKFEVWDSGGSQICYLCEICYKGLDGAARLHLRKSDQTTILKHYENYGKGWHEVDHQTYNKKVQVILTKQLPVEDKKKVKKVEESDDEEDEDPPDDDDEEEEDCGPYEEHIGRPEPINEDPPDSDDDDEPVEIISNSRRPRVNRQQTSSPPRRTRGRSANDEGHLNLI